jgi:hypothetical protein
MFNEGMPLLAAKLFAGVKTYADSIVCLLSGGLF